MKNQKPDNDRKVYMHGTYKREADEHLRKKDYDRAMEAYTSVRF
jgi:hypothetical protein